MLRSPMERWGREKWRVVSVAAIKVVVRLKNVRRRVETLEVFGM